MKRTGEIVLSVIGVIINILMLVGVFLLNAFFSDEQVRREFEQELENDPDLAASGMNVSDIIDLFSGLGTYFIIVVLISTILSIVAIVVVRGNRKPKLAGGLLIGSALLVGLGTLLLGWLPALLFLIAGIMCFARKPKVTEPVSPEDEYRPL
ncbi:DUF4064 domain-containing protein [Jeotgalibacillus proteolyticus]|uniref:DUF4064 domain-containing protein n=1 Tax=Jeotgalibacillus proteolyticus TaxID=2082395 RepID=UPI0014301FCB|nr:DUF4064 domain-containing protein [Jeotgalibacillus proteolyticus]